MKLQTKSNITASVGTVLFMVAVFLILWLIYFEVPQEDEDEGVMVSFGEVMEEGGGMPDAPQYMPSEAAEAASTPSAPSQEPLLTQEDESAAEAARVEKERQQKIEADRLAKERAEAERQAAEQRKKDAAIANADKWKNAFGNTSSAEGANGQPGDNGSIISVSFTPLSVGAIHENPLVLHLQE